ncbi:hypothetical protein [Oceanibaculum nanhaiense]|uniref:hypothetical protein n=1 Tax=Oceanibaculum nanhaiense TaxID=1909734 RepID=UPI003F6E84DC
MKCERCGRDHTARFDKEELLETVSDIALMPGLLPKGYRLVDIQHFGPYGYFGRVEAIGPKP